MAMTIFARQQDAIGLYGVCRDGSRHDPQNERGQGRWEHGVNFITVADLAAQINQVAASEHIYRLGISCHGSDDGSNPNTFGGVAIEGRNRTWLMESNVDSFLPYLNSIGRRLERNAVVYFFSCRVGGTEAGRRLLMRLSQIWPSRRVVGFVEEGHQHWRHQSVPDRFGRCELPGVQFGAGANARWGDYNLATAVSARNGQIVMW